MTKSKIFYFFIYFLSFVFLIIHLNFNVRSFKKSHELQALTLELQDLQKDVEGLELDYYSKINLENVRQQGVERLGMVRQEKVLVFSNRDIQAR